MKTHLAGLFNVIADVLESMINGFLWILQTPNPLVIIAVFVAIAWVLQRNWKICVCRRHRLPVRPEPRLLERDHRNR